MAEQTRLLSNDIEILMAEWLTYKAMDLYRRGPYSCVLGNDLKTISNALLFETTDFSLSACWFMSSVYPLFLDLKILIPMKSPQHYKAGCSFKNVKLTITKNLKALRFSSLHYILSEEDIPWDAGVAFQVEKGCEPLMNAFVKEGYAIKRGRLYVWEAKFEGLFDRASTSVSADLLKKYKAIDQSIDTETREMLETLASENQLIHATHVLTKTKNLKLGSAKSFLEDYLFPEIWGKLKPEHILKWYKENR